MKTLFLLIALIDGREYVQHRHLTLEHCVARLMVEREALRQVQAKHPETKANFQCKQEN
jgi:hypothetical protein